MRFFSRAAAAAILFSALPHAALSQSAATEPVEDTSGDLGAMRARAAADPEVAQHFEQIVTMAQRSNQVSAGRNLLRYIFQDARWLGEGLSEPVRIETVTNLDPARRRARAASQILVADLNGDWEITRDELMETLKYAPNESSAQAFMLADSDRNDILTTDEIRAAIAQMARNESRGGPGPVNLMPVFDFDGDGYLAPEELDRGLTAIGG